MKLVKKVKDNTLLGPVYAGETPVGAAERLGRANHRPISEYAFRLYDAPERGGYLRDRHGVPLRDGAGAPRTKSVIGTVWAK